MKNEEEFKKELETLINKYSMENDSNTPDYILASYLVGCLKSYNHAIYLRDRWFNFKTFNKTNLEE